MLSDVDIRNELGKGIVIEPFEEDSLTPVGYDMRVGDYGFSWKKRRHIRIDQDGQITIEPNDTVLIRTYERIQLSTNFGGTVHSLVPLVSHGLTHISTTIDPGWSGRLLVQLHNHQSIAVPLKFKETFCTVCLYKMESEARKKHGREADRMDIERWLTQIEQEARAKEREARAKEAKLFYRSPRIQLIIAAIIIIAVSILIWRLNPDWLAPTISILGIASLFIIEALRPSR